MSDKAFLTVNEAAEVLRIGRSSAYEGVRRGQIPSFRIGRLIRIPKAALIPPTVQSEAAGLLPEQPVAMKEAERYVGTPQPLR